MLFLLLCSIVLTPSTPEEFLAELCENSTGQEGAEFWSSCASPEVQSDRSSPDSLAQILEGMNDLSVITGSRTLFQDRGNDFIIEFGESKWTWTDSTGNLNTKQGLSVLICTNGRYTWSEIPVLTSRSVSFGQKEQMIAGILGTFLVLIFTFVILIWAKRRYL